MTQHHKQKKIYVILPVYNEGEIISSVIDQVRSCGHDNIVLVDDGSTDNTESLLREMHIIVYLKHVLNRGKGAAVRTGIAYARRHDADVVVTLDGDGQHDPADIATLLEKIDEGYDVVLGTRTEVFRTMPWYKMIANIVGNAMTWFAFGLWVHDSQSGFRAFNKKALAVIDVQGDRYEYDSEVIREIHRHKLRYVEVPIRVIYTAYSMNKQTKQGFKNGLKTALKIFWHD